MAVSVMLTSVVTTSAMNNMIASVMNISVLTTFVMPMSEGSCHLISDGWFGDDHVSGHDISDEFGDNIGDEYISDSYVCDACE
jgi:hypothetical protein